MTDNKRKELLSKAKPILFNAEMVRAILDGRKTVTRRVVKPQPVNVMTEQERRCRALSGADPYGFCVGTMDTEILKKLPYHYGDILYVRETWKKFCGMLYGWENGTYIPLDDFEGYQYKADEQCVCTKGINPFCDGFEDQKSDIRFDDKWHPSIHMLKEAARIFLRVTNVRVERLQDITEEQATAEGFVFDTDLNFGTGASARRHFFEHWDNTIKKSDLDKYGWDANPWVWVIEFERMN